ncbi:hypothetical protein N9Y42_09015 [Mariniblastus sp.]|nr:hypothetical protein [Mariniblastus sp.]
MLLAIHGKSNLARISPADFTHMISIGDAGRDLSQYRPPSINSSAHLCMNFRDRKTRERRDAPTEDDIRPLFRWLDASAEIRGLLVHCGAGMSRSPAIALLALCHIHPDLITFENMCRVESCSVAKYIWPNPLVVELGDSIMERDGQIVSGVDGWRRKVQPNSAE